MAKGLPMTRRQLLSMIGYAAGASVMYQSMTSLGYAAESSYTGPVQLKGKPKKGTSVVVLGAGLAGMVAALELRNAGYDVKILEYQNRAGGRNISWRRGVEHVELGGEKQVCEFDEGQYFNPGPWRIPFHHHAVLDYCKRLGVKMEPFLELNFNSLLHSTTAFDGKPQKYSHILSDYRGGVTELLAKAVNAGALDQEVTTEDKEVLLASLKNHGALDSEYRYVKGPDTSLRRGYKKAPGGGLDARPEYSEPIKFSDVVNSKLWANMEVHFLEEFQSTMFQPVGGMDQIGQAFYRELKDIVQLNAKVVEIKQDDTGVTVHYTDTNGGDEVKTERADFCVNTIPLSVLSQIPMNVGRPMQDAINAVPYGPSIKVGTQYKRRFWEQDEHIYGGISYTDLPITQISYPSAGADLFSDGKGVLLNGYMFGLDALKFGSMPVKERIAKALEYSAQLHPQIKEEAETSMVMSWSRVPWTLGCFGVWTDKKREQHYDNLCRMDGRIVLAGEHASYIPAWQEGAVLSGIAAIEQLHEKAMAN